MSEENLIRRGIRADVPVFRFDVSLLKEFGVERVQLVNECLIDFYALFAGVKVL